MNPWKKYTLGLIRTLPCSGFRDPIDIHLVRRLYAPFVMNLLHIANKLAHIQIDKHTAVQDSSLLQGHHASTIAMGVEISSRPTLLYLNRIA